MAALGLSFRLLAVLLAALSLGMSFAHVLEMPPRLRWTRELWMATTNFGGLYWLFGRVGGVIEVGAIAAAFVLAHAMRRERRAFRFALSGALLLAAGLGLWAVLVAPANAVMAGWVPERLPPDFAAVRGRWEGGHAAVAVAKLAGFASLVLGLLLDGSLPRLAKDGLQVE